MDRKEQARLGAYAGAAQAEEAAVWALVGKLACVMQAFAGCGDERALTKELRQLQAEAMEAFGQG